MPGLLRCRAPAATTNERPPLPLALEEIEHLALRRAEAA